MKEESLSAYYRCFICWCWSNEPDNFDEQDQTVHCPYCDRQMEKLDHHPVKDNRGMLEEQKVAANLKSNYQANQTLWGVF